MTDYLTYADEIAAFKGCGFPVSRAAGSQGVYLALPHDPAAATDPPHILAGQSDDAPETFWVSLYLDGVNGDLMAEGSLADCRQWLKSFDAAAALAELAAWNTATAATDKIRERFPETSRETIESLHDSIFKTTRKALTESE